MGRDLSMAPSAFHSDTFLSTQASCFDRRSRPCRDHIGVTAHPCFKSFSCNTYESPRKCCKQKTYALAKLFTCNRVEKSLTFCFARLSIRWFDPIPQPPDLPN